LKKLHRQAEMKNYFFIKLFAKLIKYTIILAGKNTRLIPRRNVLPASGLFMPDKTIPG